MAIKGRIQLIANLNAAGRNKFKFVLFNPKRENSQRKKNICGQNTFADAIFEAWSIFREKPLN